MKTEKKAFASLISAVFLFGTIGAFRVYIADFPSGWLSMLRGIGGAIFLLLILCLRRQNLSFPAIKKNALYLLLSGAAIGFNWILLFEAYRYTSIARATLSYYMQPVFVILASVFLLHERITKKKIVCVLVALFGMVLVSGVLKPTDIADGNTLRGVLLGVSAGALYAADILLNQQMRDIAIYDRTVVQLTVAGAVVIPYAFFAESVSAADFTPRALLVIGILAVVHTGIAYALYFGAMAKLPAQTVALFSYLDPAIAILLTPLIPNQPALTLPEILGAVLILGAAAVSEKE